MRETAKFLCFDISRRRMCIVPDDLCWSKAIPWFSWRNNLCNRLLKQYGITLLSSLPHFFYFNGKWWKYSSLRPNSCVFSEDLARCFPVSGGENFLIIKLWTISGIIFLSTQGAVFLWYLHAWRWSKHCQCLLVPKQVRKLIIQNWIIWKYCNVPFCIFKYIFWNLMPSDFRA